MRKYLFGLLPLLVLMGCGPTEQQREKPNVLWLVVEDMSPYLSAYGHEWTHTPALDSLAKASIVFERAYSNGAQCSPARSTLISGVYAPMLATDWHREARPVPEEFYFPPYLQKAGYYCTNNSKRDYNSSNTPAGLWDASNKRATYLGRPRKEQPFFAVFNYSGTHTKRVATRDTLGRHPRTVNPGETTLPAYLPDLPEIRDDIAWHYDAVSEMDKWVKGKLGELRRSGEADNTIIFFYSDHGGCLPRGKAFVYETGTRVPLMVSFPEKFRHLAGSPVPSRSKQLVGFVDFAPTLYNLLGIKPPEYMVGRPFLGENLPKPKDYVFLYRANQERSFIPSRALTDGRYRFVWNFNTAYPNGTRQSYQWQMPSYQAWDRANANGVTDSLQSAFWQPMVPFELYETESDPYETRNLIDEPGHQQRVATMREALRSLMKKHQDLGLYPWSMRHREDSIPFYQYVRDTRQDVGAVIGAAALASTAEIADLPKLEQLLQSKSPAVRYWGTIGVLRLLQRGALAEAPLVVKSNFADTLEATEVRLLSAEALVKANQNPKALAYILKMVGENYYTAYAVLQNLGALAKPIEKELEGLLSRPQLKQFYIRSALANTGYYPYDSLYRG